MGNHVEAMDLAERQHGLVARRQLVAAGWSKSSISRLGVSQYWYPLTSRVLRRRGAPLTDHQGAMASVLDVGGDAVSSHFTAARMWGLTGCPLYPLTVTTTLRSRHTTGIAQVRTVRLLPSSWVTNLQGIPIVRPELLALQLFATCSRQRADRLTDRLWSMRLLSERSIAALLSDIGESGRNGTAGLRAFAGDRGPEYEPPSSGLESRVMEILGNAGRPMRRQVNLGCDRWVGRVDFLHCFYPLVVEVQSEMYHSSLVDGAADAKRRIGLQRAGFRVLEITDDMVWTRPAEVERLVREQLGRFTVQP